jgi:hypothetical protein
MKKRGRKPIFGRAMTASERKQRWVKRQQAAMAANRASIFGFGDDGPTEWPGVMTMEELKAAVSPEFAAPEEQRLERGGEDD